MHKLDNKVSPQQGCCTSLIANQYTTEDCNRLSFSPVVDIPSGPCSNYIPLGLQIMTFHILASNLCMAGCALGDMWHFASLPFAFLVLTTLLQLMFLTARRGRQTSSGRIKGWVGPLRRSALQEVGGMRDEKDGGPSRVLRCEARLATALVGMKSVDIFPLYLFSVLCCSIQG